MFAVLSCTSDQLIGSLAVNTQKLALFACYRQHVCNAKIKLFWCLAPLVGGFPNLLGIYLSIEIVYNAIPNKKRPLLGTTESSVIAFCYLPLLCF